MKLELVCADFLSVCVSACYELFGAILDGANDIFHLDFPLIDSVDQDLQVVH